MLLDVEHGGGEPRVYFDHGVVVAVFGEPFRTEGDVDVLSDGRRALHVHGDDLG
jgi:hypothetical protein